MGLIFQLDPFFFPFITGRTFQLSNIATANVTVTEKRPRRDIVTSAVTVTQVRDKKFELLFDCSS